MSLPKIIISRHKDTSLASVEFEAGRLYGGKYEVCPDGDSVYTDRTNGNNFCWKLRRVGK